MDLFLGQRGLGLGVTFAKLAIGLHPLREQCRNSADGRVELDATSRVSIAGAVVLLATTALDVPFIVKLLRTAPVVTQCSSGRLDAHVPQHDPDATVLGQSVPPRPVGDLRHVE